MCAPNNWCLNLNFYVGKTLTLRVILNTEKDVLPFFRGEGPHHQRHEGQSECYLILTGEKDGNFSCRHCYTKNSRDIQTFAEAQKSGKTKRNKFSKTAACMHGCFIKLISTLLLWQLRDAWNCWNTICVSESMHVNFERLTEQTCMCHGSLSVSRAYRELEASEAFRFCERLPAPLFQGVDAEEQRCRCRDLESAKNGMAPFLSATFRRQRWCRIKTEEKRKKNLSCFLCVSLFCAVWPAQRRVGLTCWQWFFLWYCRKWSVLCCRPGTLQAFWPERA